MQYPLLLSTYKMKFLLFSAFVATISYANADKAAKLLAAMNAGMLNGMMAGGLNPPLLAGGGVGFIGQPQFAQFVPGVPAFPLRGPVPNMYPAAVNTYQFPVVGIPQMGQMNLPQQAQMGMAGGVMQPPIQQVPVQLDPLRRFRRQVMKSDNTVKSAVDTQIPTPTESVTTPTCKKDKPLNN
ncbi:secretory calcium-binding phosphoprotein 9 [Cololabis saira]|uniref:secretory calcium-binding phosphoprotein 9 n=1 Tax=Cololabis saira TaxID=129043 RepID=UPI002AD3012C|nr:secretory calcium-binding phosphoprotein 9 [Cololabis saira]